MIDSVIEKQLISQLDRLDRDRQRQVLDFARFLVMNQPVGTQGKDLLHLAGTISQEDARSILTCDAETAKYYGQIKDSLRKKRTTHPRK